MILIKEQERLTKLEINRWCRALEGKTSTEYRQTIGQLVRWKRQIVDGKFTDVYEATGMCCLGVEGHVNDPTPWEEFQNHQCMPGADREALLDRTLDVNKMRSYLHDTERFDEVSSNRHGYMQPCSILATLNDKRDKNDDRFTFGDIAKLVRACVAD